MIEQDVFYTVAAWVFLLSPVITLFVRKRKYAFNITLIGIIASGIGGLGAYLVWFFCAFGWAFFGKEKDS